MDNQAGVTALDAVLQGVGRLAALAFAHRVRGVIYVIVGTAIGITIALILPLQYTTNATFLTQGSSSLKIPAILQGAAASFGLDTGDEYSPKFYADLLVSRPVLRSAVLHAYRAGRDSTIGPRTYLQIEHFDEAPPAVGVDRAMRHLRERISAFSDIRTKVVTLAVRAGDPVLAQQIAEHLLQALDSLNLGFRQSQSRESREFYETRLMQTREELASAEQTVRDFLQRNRVMDAPGLQFEFQRLQREADVKRTLYTTVVQHYEQARLQESRTVPTLTVLSEPFVPVKKSWPPRRLIVVTTAFAAIAILWAQVAVGIVLARLREEGSETWHPLEQHIPGLHPRAGAQE